MEEKLYYYPDRGKLIFSSNILDLIGSKKPETDKKSLYYFLTLGYIPGKATIFKGIRKLSINQSLVQKNNKSFIKSWDSNIISIKKPLPFFEKRIIKTLKSLVKDIDLKHKSLGILSTGGLDSSILIALLSKHREQIDTYFISIENEECELYNQSVRESIGMLSRKFNINHNEIPITLDNYISSFPKMVKALNEPIFDEDLPAVFSALRKNKKVKALASGMGMDELFSNDSEIIEKRLPFLSESLAAHNKISGSTAILFPYLDTEFIKLAMKTPLDFKLKNGTEKYIVRKTFSSLLPKEIIKGGHLQSKIPSKWLKVLCGIYREDVLKSEFLKGYLKKRYIEKAVKSKDLKSLIKLIILDIWHKEIEKF